MKMRLNVSQERQEELRAILLEHGIEVDEVAELVLSESNAFAGTLMVRRKGERVLLPSNEIIYIESQGHTVEVHTLEETYQARERLYQVLARLDEEKFLRISNSVIIAKSKVQRITPTLSMKFILTMADGAKVDVTRSYYYIFKEAFGI